GWPAQTGLNSEGVFALGRWGMPVNLLAVAWCLFTVGNVGWPRPGGYGDVWYHRYGAGFSTAALGIVGGGYFGFVPRYKKRVLGELRAGSQFPDGSSCT